MEDGKRCRRRFWTEFLEKAKKAYLHINHPPSASRYESNYMPIGRSKGGLTFYCVILIHGAHVELYIDRANVRDEENKGIFNELVKSKNAIEANFGGPLKWQRLPHAHACRIKKDIGSGGYLDEDRWPDTHEAMIAAMIRLEKALKPHIAKPAI